MDNDIFSLQKIGLREVSKKTHIEVKQLEYIINAQYDKLNKINTVGFVKILSREYKIDFTQWLEGFNAYVAEQHLSQKEEKEKIFIRAQAPKEPRKIVRFFVFLVLLFSLGSLLYTFQNRFDFHGLFEQLLGEVSTQSTSQNATFQSAPVVQETATTLGVKVEERIVENTGVNASVEAVVVPIEKNTSNQSSEIEQKPLVKNDLPNTALLSPKRKVWVGMILLDEGTRKENIGDKNITIDLTKRQLIKTGNGYFQLSYDGSVEDFTEQGSTRFLVEKGVLSKISEETFIKLNQGKNW
jgi:hypothetical protein